MQWSLFSVFSLFWLVLLAIKGINARANERESSTPDDEETEKGCDRYTPSPQWTIHNVYRIKRKKRIPEQAEMTGENRRVQDFSGATKVDYIQVHTSVEPQWNGRSDPSVQLRDNTTSPVGLVSNIGESYDIHRKYPEFVPQNIGIHQSGTHWTQRFIPKESLKKFSTTPIIVTAEDQDSDTGGSDTSNEDDFHQEKDPGSDFGFPVISKMESLDTGGRDTGGRDTGERSTSWWTDSPVTNSIRIFAIEPPKRKGDKNNLKSRGMKKIENEIYEIEHLMDLFKDVVEVIHSSNTAQLIGERGGPETKHQSSSPADEGWGEWSEWSSCSVSCGVGVRFRSRKRQSSQIEADIQELQEKECRLPDCPPYPLLGYLTKIFNN